MLVKRMNEYVELPTRGSKWSAGLDLYCPFDVTVPADTQKKIPLGIAVQIPDFHVGLLVPRSSMHKTPLRMANSMGVIDSDYNVSFDVSFTVTATSEEQAMVKIENLLEIMRNEATVDCHIHKNYDVYVDEVEAKLNQLSYW